MTPSSTPARTASRCSRAASLRCGAWPSAVAATALPRIRFYDLGTLMRRTCWRLYPKVASERLGHSKVGITLDLYSHILPGMQEDAAAKVDAALLAAINRRP
jgi:integrase